MQRTKIPWATHVWNPITGCSLASEGCEHCYAKSISNRFGWTWGKPVMHWGRLKEPELLKNPSRIFVCSMGDLFHEHVKWDELCAVMAVIEKCKQHTFILLTKRPAAMKDRLEGTPVLPNVWFGVTCENQQRADERIPILLQIPAAVRWVSVEPMLGPVRLKLLSRWCFHTESAHECNIKADHLHWIVVGPETGPGARPCKPEWFQSLADQCHEAGVPYFDKRENFIRRDYPRRGMKAESYLKIWAVVGRVLGPSGSKSRRHAL